MYQQLWNMHAAEVAHTVVLVGSGAPSFVWFGAYVPAWLLFAVFGIIVAIAVRVALVALQWSEALPFQFLVCTSIGTTVALLAWLVWFGW